MNMLSTRVDFFLRINVCSKKRNVRISLFLRTIKEHSFLKFGYVDKPMTPTLPHVNKHRHLCEPPPPRLSTLFMDTTLLVIS